MSDDSSKDGNTGLGGGGGGFSDSHPETLTDPEFSDNNMGVAAAQQMTSSPTQSGDELAIQQKHEKKEKVSEGE